MTALYPFESVQPLILTLSICTLTLHSEGGTLYHVSAIINNAIFTTMSITIIDGQNEEAIDNITDTEYNPCLPMTLTRDKRINITFSPNVTSFRQWFPSSCSNHDDSVTEYLFDGAQHWNFKNLIVEDYDSGNEYALVRTVSFFGDITCFNCTFSNITNNGSNPLFESWGSLHFEQCDFPEITMESANLMSASFEDCADDKGRIECSWSSDGREFSFIDSTFSNLALSDSLVSLSNDLEVKPTVLYIVCIQMIHFLICPYFVKDEGNILIVRDCSFDGIQCSNGLNCVLFNDGLDFCDVSMTGISIRDCESGLYVSGHDSHSSITMSELEVVTSKLWTDETDVFLFFTASDAVWFWTNCFPLIFSVQHCCTFSRSRSST